MGEEDFDFHGFGDAAMAGLRPIPIRACYNFTEFIMEAPLAQIGKVNIHIFAAIIHSRNGAFDNHVKLAGLFNVEKYSEIRLELTHLFPLQKRQACWRGRKILGQTYTLLLSRQNVSTVMKARRSRRRYAAATSWS